MRQVPSVSGANFRCEPPRMHCWVCVSMVLKRNTKSHTHRNAYFHDTWNQCKLQLVVIFARVRWRCWLELVLSLCLARRSLSATAWQISAYDRDSKTDCSMTDFSIFKYFVFQLYSLVHGAWTAWISKHTCLTTSKSSISQSGKADAPRKGDHSEAGQYSDGFERSKWSRCPTIFFLYYIFDD